MKKISLLILVCLVVIATAAFAQPVTDLNNGHIHVYPAKGAGGGGGGSSLVNHGGPVLTNPQVVFIFWGFGTGTSYTTGMQNFRTQGIYNYSRMLPQYSSAASATSSYTAPSAADVFDSSTPPQNVTDADVQAEVVKWFGGKEDGSTVYEVAIPIGSYSSSGTSTSCGGPNLAYCAYHGHFTDGTNDVKYAILPYPSCSGCQSSGFTDNQNQDHFIVHETREATTDPDLNAWYDRRGNEADDKCAWSPAPFIDQTTGFAYQYEWSNSASGCVKQ